MLNNEWYRVNRRKNSSEREMVCFFEMSLGSHLQVT